MNADPRTGATLVAQEKFFVLILSLDPFPELGNSAVETACPVAYEACLWNPPGTGEVGLFLLISGEMGRPINIEAELSLPSDEAAALSAEHGVMVVLGDGRITRTEALSSVRGHLEAAEEGGGVEEMSMRGGSGAFAPGCSLCLDGHPHAVLRLKPSRFMRVTKEEAMRAVQAVLEHESRGSALH